MLVEFVGFSGSGKSTTIGEVAGLLDVQPASAQSRDWGKYRHHLAALASNPRLAVWCALRIRQVARSKLLNLCKRDYRTRQLRERSDIVLVDNSALHRLGRLAAAGVRDCEGAVQLLTSPDLMVVVTVDPHEGLRRLRDRQTRHVEKAMSDEQILVRHARYRELIRHAVEARACETIAVDTTGNAAVAPLVAARIMAATSPSLPTP
jgi:adenylate kinase